MKSLEILPSSQKLNMLATSGDSEFNTALLKMPEARRDSAAACNALLDLRRLGELDWQLNYPELLKK